MNQTGNKYSKEVVNEVHDWNIRARKIAVAPLSDLHDQYFFDSIAAVCFSAWLVPVDLGSLDVWIVVDAYARGAFLYVEKVWRNRCQIDGSLK